MPNVGIHNTAKAQFRGAISLIVIVNAYLRKEITVNFSDYGLCTAEFAASADT